MNIKPKKYALKYQWQSDLKGFAEINKYGGQGANPGPEGKNKHINISTFGRNKGLGHAYLLKINGKH